MNGIDVSPSNSSNQLNNMNNGTSSNSSISSAMKIGVNINEKDIIKLVIEFLANRDLNISMLDVERETGIINSSYSDDILFLRQLILDGQWDDAIEFIQPLKQIDHFNSKQFYFLIMKYQYLELLCLKSEATATSTSNGNNTDNHLSVDQLVTYLNDLKPYCPNEDEYKKLCLLLTSPRLQDHSEFKSWNPSSGRLLCFKEILPFVNKFLTSTPSNSNSQTNIDQIPSTDKDSTSIKPFTSQNERLVQLIVKGMLYESCVEYCQARATSSIESYNLTDPNTLLMQMQLSETDASLLSWLHALPLDTFSCPFEEKPLKLNMNKFIKPNLEATWADAILATPIKPQQLFPYNAVPSGRSRNTELMSRSLAPQYDGLSFGLSRSQIFTSGIEMQLNPTNTNDIHKITNQVNQHVPNQTNGFPKKSQQQHAYQRDLNDMTKSIALFNLDIQENSSTNNKTNTEHVNNNSSSQNTNHINNGQLTSLSNSYMNRMNNLQPTILNGIQEEEQIEDKDVNSNDYNNVGASIDVNNTSNFRASNSMNDSTLFKEYQKNKQHIVQQLEEQDKKREELVKQLKSPNVHNALNAISKSKNFNSNQPKRNEVIDESLISPKLNRKSNINNDSILNSNVNIQNQTNKNVITSASSSSTTSPPSAQSPIPSSSTSTVASKSSSKNSNHNLKSTMKSNNYENSELNSPNKLQNISTKQSNNNNNFNSETRPINEATKFDSLEDITKVASFQAVTTIEDQQAIRAIDIHPSGHFYVVGSNSKCLRVLPYPSLDNIKLDHVTKPASVLYKKSKHHYGSIYCTAWNPAGNLIATGSNDKTIKLIKFDPELMEDNDSEMELTYHNGTVRDLIFMQQEDNNILVSGGAGDCKINVLDCQTQQTLRSYSGHSGHIYTLYSWSGTKNVFVSGSQDKTCRFWDLRAPEAIQVVTPSTTIALQGSPVASVAVDPSGLLLATGHEDAACCLYDIRGSRIVQIYKPHTSDIRSIRFSTNAYYLLTSSYDNKVIITDLHGDLTKPLNWSVVAQHNDKIIQAKWHPNQMSFVTTSADRTSTVWSLPTTALASASVI